MYNTGASVLGVLAARATGTPFPEVLRTRIFEPLGMRATAFWTPDPSRLATAYVPDAGADCRSGTTPKAGGASPRPSATGRPAWFPRSMICSPSPACSSRKARRSYQAARRPR